MYIPDEFVQKDQKLIEEFIHKNPFGQLITSGEKVPLVTHLPLEATFSPGLIISGHISAFNPQAAAINRSEKALLVFNGPHTYISSGWYQKPNAPTWNYQSVHISGTLELLTSDELITLLNDLVIRYESDQDNPFAMNEIPEKYMQAMLKEIVGFRLIPEKIEACWKLSQNRNDVDHTETIKQLRKTMEQDSIRIAGEMERQRPKIV